jgi:drug/metabolite transporter (DMT)-like permease
MLPPLYDAHAVAVGEAANFAAYAYAPAAVVTPLGAFSIVVAAVGAHVLLNERLTQPMVLGCALICLGAVPLVLHAPKDTPLESVAYVATLAAQPPFLMYMLTLSGAVGALVWRVEPVYGAMSPLPAILICSLVGSLSVLLCKALSCALRLVAAGKQNLVSAQTLLLGASLGVCVTVQMGYLNKALDAFHTGRVTPIYYAMFTSCTLVASAALFRDWERSDGESLATQLCAFGVMLVGVRLLHSSDMPPPRVEQDSETSHDSGL